MKFYIGTKRLSARPMTRGEYNAYRGWTDPANEDPSVAGYLVEYDEGGKANDERHAGYISWSPSDVFEQSYRELPAGIEKLPPHQQRVVIEKAELDEKLAKLNTFRVTPTFDNLPIDERARLRAQAVHMECYSIVLGHRIAAFAG